MTLYVTADWKRFVREDDPEAAFGVARVDVDRLGLGGALAAFLGPEPEAKAAPAPADKAYPKPRNK